MWPHLAISLLRTKGYRDKYPGYSRALAVNHPRDWDAHLPSGMDALIHTSTARIERRLFG